MSDVLNESLPGRGQTVWGPAETPTASARIDHIGKEKWFSDVNVGSSPPTLRTKRMVLCRFVQNTSAGALLPKRLVSVVAGGDGSKVDGYARLTAQGFVYPLDEWLPSTGLRQYDCGWIVIRGPATVLTDLAGGANNLLPADTVLVALTGATSGATTAGRVAPQDLTGATAVLGAQLQGAIGRAISGRTTGNTNADILMDVKYAW